MILKVNGKSQTLVQVTDDSTGVAVGLYLVPEKTTIDEFEAALKAAEDQNEFDENNTLGVQRIFAYDSILSLQF